MKIYGYDPEHRLPVAVDMPTEEIGRLGIHPWLVDVFSNKTVKVDGLLFNQISHDSPLEILYNDGSEFRLWTPSRHIRIRMGTDREGNQIRAESTSVSNLPIGDLGTVLDFELIKIAPKIQIESSSGAVWVGGGSTSTESRMTSYGLERRYGGQTTAKVRLNFHISKKIQWVLHKFARFNPMIFGGAVRDTVAGDKPADIDFIVDDISEAGVRSMLEADPEIFGIKNLTATDSYGWSQSKAVFEFIYQGTKYQMVCRGNGFAQYFWDLNDFSVNQGVIDKTGLWVSRVALWDIARRQLRVVSQNRATGYGKSQEISDSTEQFMIYKWMDRAAKMAARGYTILANPFAKTDFERIQNYDKQDQ